MLLWICWCHYYKTTPWVILNFQSLHSISKLGELYTNNYVIVCHNNTVITVFMYRLKWKCNKEEQRFETFFVNTYTHFVYYVTLNEKQK